MKKKIHFVFSILFAIRFFVGCHHRYDVECFAIFFTHFSRVSGESQIDKDDVIHFIHAAEYRRKFRLIYYWRKEKKHTNSSTKIGKTTNKKKREEKNKHLFEILKCASHRSSQNLLLHKTAQVFSCLLFWISWRNRRLKHKFWDFLFFLFFFVRSSVHLFSFVFFSSEAKIDSAMEPKFKVHHRAEKIPMFSTTNVYLHVYSWDFNKIFRIIRSQWSWFSIRKC